MECAGESPNHPLIRSNVTFSDFMPYYVLLKRRQLPGSELEQGKIPYVSSHASVVTAFVPTRESTGTDTSSNFRSVFFGGWTPALYCVSGYRNLDFEFHRILYHTNRTLIYHLGIVDVRVHKVKDK